MKECLSYTSICSLKVLFNSKFILMATSLRINDVVVTRFTVVEKKSLKSLFTCKTTDI